MQQYLQNKKGLVEGVFNQVYSKYDLMNDFMSFGIHRFWKRSLINMMNPSLGKSLIDVACGTGDIGKLYLDNTDKNNKITCVDPNKGMVSQGKKSCLITIILTGSFLLQKNFPSKIISLIFILLVLD